MSQHLLSYEAPVYEAWGLRNKELEQPQDLETPVTVLLGFSLLLFFFHRS